MRKAFGRYAALALVLAASPAFAEGEKPWTRGDGVRTEMQAQGEARESWRAKMWQEIDTNGDGVVDKAEFEAHAAKRFEKMDTDGSGTLTPEEMKEHRAEMGEKMRERREDRRETREEWRGKTGGDSGTVE